MTSIRTDCCSPSRTGASLAVAALLLALFLLPAAAAGEDGYRVGPGDVLAIRVWQEPDLSGPHRVDDRGILHHVLAGAVTASGRTAPQIADDLRARLERDYLREARVTVVLENSARRKAWVLGSVAAPGGYPVGEGTRLLDIVLAAGGLRDDAAGGATLFRMGEPDPAADDSPFGGRKPREEHLIDLAALLAGNLSGNRRIEAGDVVAVAGIDAVSSDAGPRGRVRIVGEVRNPGTYELTETPTALDALLAAGGFTEYASSNKSRIIRGDGADRDEKPLRLGDIAKGRSEATNLRLEDGDLIVVPESFF